MVPALNTQSYRATASQTPLLMTD